MTSEWVLAGFVILMMSSFGVYIKFEQNLNTMILLNVDQKHECPDDFYFDQQLYQGPICRPRPVDAFKIYRGRQMQSPAVCLLAELSQMEVDKWCV